MRFVCGVGWGGGHKNRAKGCRSKERLLLFLYITMSVTFLATQAPADVTVCVMLTSFRVDKVLSVGPVTRSLMETRIPHSPVTALCPTPPNQHQYPVFSIYSALVLFLTTLCSLRPEMSQKRLFSP